VVSKTDSGTRPARPAICSSTPGFQSSGSGGAFAGRGGMNGLTISFIASRSFRSCGPQTWITTGDPGFATRPASRSARPMSVAKKNELKPVTRSNVSSS
jgi:hypothetical protein